MGFRGRILGKVKKVANKFSGEFSEPAPETMEPYERPGTPNDNAEVVMARLNRPKSAKAKGKPKS